MNQCRIRRIFTALTVFGVAARPTPAGTVPAARASGPIAGGRRMPLACRPTAGHDLLTKAATCPRFVRIADSGLPRSLKSAEILDSLLHGQE